MCNNTEILHLVCINLAHDYDAITTTHEKRWQVEVFHKFMKFNANLVIPPKRMLHTQGNQVSMAIYTSFKLECLSITNKRNIFARCRKLLISASRIAEAHFQPFRTTSQNQLVTV